MFSSSCPPLEFLSPPTTVTHSFRDWAELPWQENHTDDLRFNMKKAFFGESAAVLESRFVLS